VENIKELLTIVFATSPHRFGESDCMMALNVNIMKATQLKDCHMILCADGVNPHSDHASDEKTKKYKNYLATFAENFPRLQVIKSKNHIGLTRNYMQAWDWEKVKTPFVLLMNHDTVFNDKILDIDINLILKNWPDFINMLIFPRHCEASEWWRERELMEHPEYKKRNFFQKLSNKKTGWENCKIVFGNQDHACILKKDHFPKLIDLYYEPKSTHFLEDSIQRHLNSLENGDFKSWNKYGGCFYKENVSVHIDGQSKAGIEFTQEKDRKGETVWSNGQTSYLDFLKFQKLSSINPAINDSLKKLITQNLDFHTSECAEKFDGFFSKANYLVSLNKTSELFLDKSLGLFSSKKTSHGFIPEQNKNCPIHFVFSPSYIEIHWEQKESDNFLLKLNTSSDKKLCWGGHPRSFFCAEYKKHDLSPEDRLHLEIYDYTKKSPPYKQLCSLGLSLNTFNFFENKVVINNSGCQHAGCRLHLAKNNGAMAKYREKNNVFEVLYKNITPCQSLVGFFEYETAQGELIKSSTFECKPDPLLLHENPADILLDSFSDFFYSLNKQNMRDKNKGVQTYWGNQVQEINKLLKK